MSQLVNMIHLWPFPGPLRSIVEFGNSSERIVPAYSSDRQRKIGFNFITTYFLLRGFMKTWFSKMNRVTFDLIHEFYFSTMN